MGKLGLHSSQREYDPLKESIFLYPSVLPELMYLHFIQIANFTFRYMTAETSGRLSGVLSKMMKPPQHHLYRNGDSYSVIPLINIRLKNGRTSITLKTIFLYG